MRWAMGVAAVGGIALVWLLDTAAACYPYDDEGSYTDACDPNALSVSPWVIVATLALALLLAVAVFGGRSSARAELVETSGVG